MNRGFLSSMSANKDMAARKGRDDESGDLNKGADVLMSGSLDSGVGGDLQKMEKGSGSGDGVDCDVRKHVPEQVKPVSLGVYADVTMDDASSSSQGSQQPNVELLIANANKNFDDAMNKIQCEIGASEAILTRNPMDGTTIGTGVMSGRNGNLNKSATSGPTDGITNGIGVKSVSYAGATSNEPRKHVSNFRRLESSNKRDDVDLSVPLKVVEEVNTRFENTLYGYFLGQRLAFPVVDYYVRNAWAKFGIQKVMMNAKGFFFFKFNSSKGVDDVLENGPWLIRNVPIILKPWTLNTNLLKEDLINIPVWVKFHDVPLAMFSDDGLSLLATLIGTPKRLDAFTNQMCKESWGRSSFARCLIEVKSDEVLRDSLTVEIPLLDGSGSTIEKIRVEYEWQPPRCDKCKIFGHTLTDCPKVILPPVQPTKPVNDSFKTVNNRKKGKQGGSTIPGKGGFTKPVVGKKFQYQPKQTPPEPKNIGGNKKKTPDVASSSGTTISTSNQFDALNMDDTDTFGIPTDDTNLDVDAGCTMEVNEDASVKTGTTSQEPLVSDLMGTKKGGSTPIVEKISKLEKLLIDGKASLLDDKGVPIPSASANKRANPFSKVGDIVVTDSDEEEVLNTFDESANLFGGGHEREDELDDYDDYSKQIYDLPGELDALNAIYGFNLQGRRK